MFPPAIKIGDTVRVIAPARTMSIISQDVRDIIQKRFDEMGLKLTFGRNVEENDRYLSSSVASRVDDLHEAFADKQVKAILTVIGGFNSEELLSSIDWDLIRNNPKIFCGFSDITALSNAIYAKTGLVTFSGPHYSSFGMKHGFSYTLDYFKKAFMQKEAFNIEPSMKWSQDAWFLDQEKRSFFENTGFKVLREGKAVGRIVGGNLCTFILLGSYTPSIKDAILFLEDCCEGGPDRANFMRQFGFITRLPDFSSIKGIVFGRFESGMKWEDEDFIELLKRRSEIPNVPIIANADFGHTTPIFTFGIGGIAEIDTSNESSLIFHSFVQ